MRMRAHFTATNLKYCAMLLLNPPAQGSCAGPFPDFADGTSRYSILRRGYQIIIPAMTFTGCGQTLRWHLHLGSRNGRNPFSFAFKLWRPTPGRGFTEVRPEQSFTPSTRFITLDSGVTSAEVDYQVTFSPGDIPGLSAEEPLRIVTTTEAGVYYWVITTSTSLSKWNQDLLQLATTAMSRLPLLSIQGIS